MRPERWLALGLLALVPVLMWDDARNQMGTASPFDPNELADAAPHHEHIVVVVAALAVVFWVFRWEYIRKHPFAIAGMTALALALFILAALLACPCPAL